MALSRQTGTLFCAANPSAAASDEIVFSFAMRMPSSVVCLQLPHEVNQVVLFPGSEFEFQDQVEGLHRVFQCQKPAVVEIRWAILDTPQRERLNRSISCFVSQESLDVEVVHLVIEIKGGRMAGGALRFAKEQFLARDFAGRGLPRVEPARDG